ncbi:cilia- and flagella-associated protein HOATZ [Anableps anableps]
MGHQSAHEGKDGELFIVFDGSSPEDVARARQFWSSLSLLPPLESRLESTDIRQRLPVSRPQPRETSAVPGPSGAVLLFADWQRKEDERRRYEALAGQRNDFLALLERQRQLRIQRELVSAAVKPERKVGGNKQLEPPEPDTELEKELIEHLR